MHDNINSVEDIDAMLDQEFGITEDADVETQLDESNLDEGTPEEVSTNTDAEEESDDENNQDGSENGTTNQNDADESTESTESTEKSDKSAKEKYAFAEMRKQIADLKNQLKSSENNDSLLKDIASQYGYTDVEEFAKAVETAKVNKEAQAKGVDPELYRKLYDSNKRIAELERENNNRKLMESAQKLKSSIDKAVVDYNLGDNGVNEIFDSLEKAGYDVSTLLGLPNHDLIIKGVLSDKIAEISKQKQIEKQIKLDNIADGKHEDGVADKSFDIDAFIDDDLKAYKAENYY